VFGVCIMTGADGGQSASLTWTSVLSSSGHGFGPGMKLDPRGKDMEFIPKISPIAATGTPLRAEWAGSWEDETGR
jgi:hypothetical protein